MAVARALERAVGGVRKPARVGWRGVGAGPISGGEAGNVAPSGAAMARLLAALVSLAPLALHACAPTDASVLPGEVELAAGVPRIPSDAGGPALPSSFSPTLFASIALDARAPLVAYDDPPELPAITNPEPEVPPPAPPYECRRPPIAIRRTAACRAGQPYPACRWQMPMPRETGRAVADGEPLYSMWRNTVEDRWWGRPALVGVLVAAAREFRRVHPEQALAVGDLDAIGPRHKTHDRGVDVDLYLPGAMVQENEGAGAMPWNYWDEDPRRIEDLRWRVEELARILATCTEGRLRIYYNDPVVEQRFHAWFREQGYRSPFGEPMQPHNELHQFHFHVTLADDVAPPPLLRSLTAPPAAPAAPRRASSPPR
jgi:hypothetical protein